MNEVGNYNCPRCETQVEGHHRFCFQCGFALLGLSSTPASDHFEDSGERRHITVLFCDLVGSTALSSQMDPEDLGELMRGYQNAAAHAVGEFDGFVAKFLGDGVLAYFGYPRAHEDDPERAVRAGQAIIDGIGKLPQSDEAPLQVRIGISSGLVVVGELLATGSASEQTVIGETPNLAARLQECAGANQIIVSEATRKLIGDHFQFSTLGPQNLKGFSEPIEAFWVQGERSDRMSLRQSLVGDSRLLGRADELQKITEAWKRTQSGQTFSRLPC